MMSLPHAKSYSNIKYSTTLFAKSSARAPTPTPTSTATPPTGSALDCSNPIILTCGVPYNGNNSSGQSNVDYYSCTNWYESGPEVVHEIVVNSYGTLTAELSNLNDDLDVFILQPCNENACLAYGNTTATISVTPGTYYIVVDGYYGAISSYTLTVTCPGGTPTGTPPTGTATPTPTGTQPTGTATPTPTGTQPTGTATPTPTGTQPTGTATPTPTGTQPTGTATPTPTGTQPTGTATPTPTGTQPTGTATPTPTGTQPVTPTPTPTETQPPTSTPTYTPPPTSTPTYTPPPTSTPQPSATPTPGIPIIDIQLNQRYFTAGDRFHLTVDINNPGPAITVEEYIILDYHGEYWFWPSWIHYPEGYDYKLIDLPPWDSIHQEILDFIWPGGVGSDDGVIIWAGMLRPGTTEIIGEIDYVVFGWK